MVKDIHLQLEIVELLLSGESIDRKHAAFLADRLDEPTLIKLRAAAAEIGMLAEDKYLEKSRKRRAQKEEAANENR